MGGSPSATSRTPRDRATGGLEFDSSGKKRLRVQEDCTSAHRR
jgi:hypothetical protein